MKTLNTKLTALAACCALPMMFAAANANAFDFEVDGTKVTVGGYVKMMMNYDTSGIHTAPYNGDLFCHYSIPVDGTRYADSDDLDFTARESRLFVTTSKETEYGTLTSKIEGDFFADINSDGPTWSNSHGFRIRHAFVQLKDGSDTYLAGQTWTNFMDFASSMPTMDFSADPGSPFVRQAQVKYQHDFRPGHNISVSLENPTIGLCAAGPTVYANCGADTQDKVPDMIVKYFYANKTFTFSPRAVLRRFEIDGQSAFGYGLAAGASMNFGAGHKVVMNAMYGDGIGRYAGLGFNTGAGLDADGDVATFKYESINGGVQFKATDKLLVTVGAGYARQDDEDYKDGTLGGGATKHTLGLHSYIYYNMTKDLQYAVGITNGRLTIQDGREGQMTRYQAYVKYDF
ncbi:porin [Shewanella avicenniae]|uniref:Porin n=1 Tax=Shewanella avicenniae TaxID=2814294 RepID=A0ABX7QP04_9GAMM|nr:DcaP family trimeric outer membrane transporter [Shewanella avicenniae]QSX32989.1 porin [Shewanella avicenniae]